MAVPKLRFKDDNRQDYPEWEENKLGDIGCVMRGLTYKPTDVRDDGIRVFRSSNVSEDTFIYGEDDVFVDVNAVNIPFVQNGDILITAANGSSRLVGKHSIIHGVLNDTAVHGGFMLLIRSKDSAFINSSMYSSWYKKFVYKFVAGGNGAIGNLKKSDLENVHLFVPCEKEKNKINDFLTTVEKRITAQQNIIADLEETKKGLLQKIFSQEIRFKDDNGQDYPEWEKSKLLDLCDVRDGTHDTPKYVDDGYPLVTSKNLLDNGTIDLSNALKISKVDYDKINERSKVDIGDIIFGMIGTIGKPVITAFDGFAIKNVALLKKKNRQINFQYLYQYFFSTAIKKQFIINAAGGTQQFIALGTIRSLEIMCPIKAEQQKIADFLSTFDKKITAEKQILSDLQEMKKGLLQQMFV